MVPLKISNTVDYITKCDLLYNTPLHLAIILNGEEYNILILIMIRETHHLKRHKYPRENTQPRVVMITQKKNV